MKKTQGLKSLRGGGEEEEGRGKSNLGAAGRTTVAKGILLRLKAGKRETGSG